MRIDAEPEDPTEGEDNRKCFSMHEDSSILTHYP